jgi:endoglucanase
MRHVNRRTILKAAATLASLPCGNARGQPAEPFLTGVNLAGAEFGSVFPGQFGKHYTYPSSIDIAQQAALGFNVIRLPFRWERLQPDMGGPFDTSEWDRLSATVRAISRAGMRAIVDPHNYAHRHIRRDGFSAKHVIGSAAVPTSAFSTFWAELARRLTGEPTAIFGLINEPAEIEAAAWLDIANKAIAAIRATGARNVILMPGVAYTGAHSWYAAGNTLMEQVVDPAKNLAIDVHQYFDSDSSGRTPRAVSSSIGTERIEAFQEWARVRKFKAFLGEFGAGAEPVSLAAIEDLLTEIANNRDVWIGWSAWAAGPWWPPSDPLRLSPNADGSWPPQTILLSRIARRSSAPAWPKTGSAIDLDFARDRYAGTERLDHVLAVARPEPAAALKRDGGLHMFDANQPRRTDLGLLIEGASRNLLSASATPAPVDPLGVKIALPLPGGNAKLWRLSQSPLRWLGAPVTRQTGEQHLYSFSVFVLGNPLDAMVLEITAAQSRARFDLATGRGEALTTDTWVSMSASGEWRHITVTFRPAGEMTITLRAASGRGANARSPSEVLIWGPALEQGAGSMLTEVERTGETVTAIGELAHLLGHDDMTVVIETRRLTAAPVARPFLTIGGRLLLGRRPDGGLETGHSTDGSMLPVPPGQWMGKRRSALSISQRTGNVVIATTARPGVVVQAGAAPRDGVVRIGGLGATAMNGCVTRLTVWRAAVDLTQLVELVS